MRAQRHRVAITGLGLVSPYGGDITDFFARLCDGQSALRHLQLDEPPHVLALPFGCCADFDPDHALGRGQAAQMDRFAQLGCAAGLAAWADAGLTRSGEEAERQQWGCAWGTALGGTQAYEDGYRGLWQKGRARVSPMTVVRAMNNASNAHLSILLGLGGYSASHTAACASSAMAIGEAFARIRSGAATVMLAGGSEMPQSYGVLRAWEAMRVLASAAEADAASACRPFGRERSGLVLGEGAAALVLEQWQRAQARGARIYGELIGFGVSCDHSHLVRPEVDGQVRALRQTLVDAALNCDEVDYINAHATGTEDGDVVEIKALQTVFGEHASALAVSATKSMHGHLLGAASALEALITVLALRDGVLPPTAHLQGNLDPACAGVDHLASARHNTTAKVALSSSFAFGGSNAVLAFRAPPHEHKGG